MRIERGGEGNEERGGEGIMRREEGEGPPEDNGRGRWAPPWEERVGERNEEVGVVNGVG
jgi:hypothetical protein